MDKRKQNQTNDTETEDDSGNEDTDEDETQEEKWQEMNGRKAELPSEYWHAQKLVKYIKV